MMSPDDYRERERQGRFDNERHCREQAKLARNEHDRAAWLHMADQWAAMATPNAPPPPPAQQRPVMQQQQVQPKDEG